MNSSSINVTNTEINPMDDVGIKFKPSRVNRSNGIKVKRVVLIDGVPAVRGRPTRETIGRRTYVYIPVDATYDVNVYGIGFTYNAYRNITPIKIIQKETYLDSYPMAAKYVEKTDVID